MNEKSFDKGKLINYTVIAVGLILIGCICILFAFSINTYTQNKLNAKKELHVVQGIATELEYYKFLQEAGSERMNEVIGAAERLLNAIRNPKLQPSKDEIDLDLHKLTWLFLSATPTTKYVALNASGDFSLISSVSLRNKFAHLNADQEKLLQFEAIQVRYVDQQLRPFLNRSMDRTTIDTYQKADSLFTTLHPSPFTTSHDDLLRNREFANILVDLLFCTKRIMLPYKRIAIDIKEMEEIIANEYPSIIIEPYKPF